MIEEGPDRYRWGCNTCPYIYNVTKKMIFSHYPAMKEVDDVLGGSAAWENVDATDVVCPKCENNRAYFMQIQTRSADEPMTIFYKCTNSDCGYRWKE